jgi:hypothetical protein
MASKRNLKRNINNLTFELVSECYTYKYFHPEKSHEQIDKALEDIVNSRNDLINRVNNPLHKEDFRKNRTHFRLIAKDMKNMLSLMDNIAE